MTRNAIICHHFVILFLGKELEWWWAVTIFVIVTCAYFKTWKGWQAAFIIFLHNCKNKKNKKRMTTSSAIVHRHFFSWKLTKTTMSNVIVNCAWFETWRRQRAAFIVLVHNCKKKKTKKNDDKQCDYLSSFFCFCITIGEWRQAVMLFIVIVSCM